MDDIIRRAQHIAAKMTRGSVLPYDGGRSIWRECQLALVSGDHRLDPFVYWASEYEDTHDDSRRALCDMALRLAAEMLVQRGSAV